MNIATWAPHRTLQDFAHAPCKVIWFIFTYSFNLTSTYVDIPRKLIAFRWCPTQLQYLYCMLICQIAAASQYYATTGSATLFTFNCVMHPILFWALISFALSVLFDMTILMLMLAKLCHKLQPSGQVTHQAANLLQHADVLHTHNGDKHCCAWQCT